MVSYWIGMLSTLHCLETFPLTPRAGYGTNYIGGTGASQSNAAWLVPVCIQIAPAVILGVGILFMPPRFALPLFLLLVSPILISDCSPRWLMTKGRENECLEVIANLRNLPTDNDLVQLEYLEVKAQHRFEQETSLARFPQYHSPGLMNKVKLEYHQYLSLLTNRSLFKRTIVAVFIMVFQQCEISTPSLQENSPVLNLLRVWNQCHSILCIRQWSLLQFDEVKIGV
jgi:hypothetical protein